MAEPKPGDVTCPNCGGSEQHESACAFDHVPLLSFELPPRRKLTPSGGKKWDDGKARWALLPRSPAEAIIRALMYGAAKYEPDNWKKVVLEPTTADAPSGRERYYDAAMRHLTKWGDGEENDPESGLNHLAHAGACLVFLLWEADRNLREPNF